MYQAFFGLREAPFALVPDPRFLYLSERYREALVHLFYGLRDGGGFVLLSGEVGTGKTLAARTMLEHTDPQCQLALILNPLLTSQELLLAIATELGAHVPAMASLAQLTEVLHHHFLHNHAAGHKTIVLVDEAQHLSPAALEQLRLLTNLETGQTKLLQVILIGQPELAVMLDLPVLRQLAQRITARYHLTPLGYDESLQYLQHRWQVAAGQGWPFSRAAGYVLYRCSGGIPRCLNLLAERCLMRAYGHQQRQIGWRCVLGAWRELRGQHALRLPRLWFSSWLSTRHSSANTGNAMLSAPITIALGAGAIYLLAVWQPSWFGLTPTPTSTPQVTATALSTAAPVASKPNLSAFPSASESRVSSLPRAAVGDSSETLSGVRTIASTPQQALAVLFQVWGYQLPSGQADCHAASALALRCYQGTASLARLAALNHPAVLSLQEQQQNYAAVLYRLSAQDAELLVGERRWRVSRSWLEAHWNGEFTLLWRPPEPSSQRVIRRGDQGALVQWLASRLPPQDSDVAASQSTTSVAPNIRFDVELEQRLRQFQQLRGLPADAMAGPQTLIALSAGSGGPLLAQVASDPLNENVSEPPRVPLVKENG
ncbi:Putative general secretion pathway protein A [Plesiomonas shigelloides]|uniref:AAA family ATPase n=1 Tax=Plesiomonas shigelloides TaxID=703 RepID=UPI000D8F2441|nr:AAA family ATPase [Plesiomonas shigelloides]SPZ45515.1 Putative general secretion pathway protein A [Plesiomonas shigelloides]